MRCSPLLLILCVGLLLMHAAPLSAQYLPPNLRVAPELALNLSSAPPPFQPPPLDEYHKPLRGARFRIAAGVGLLVGGLVGMARGVAKHTCYGEKDSVRLQVPAYAGAVTASVGLGFTIAGSLRRSRVPEAYRKSHHAAGAASAIGLGVLAGSTIAMFVLSMPERVSCASD
jgi:hypothetical protein